MKHLLFYDGECPLCNRAVRFVLAADKREDFAFAPLGGETAARYIADLHLKDPTLDTLVLLQDVDTKAQERLIEARGALRILWLLGGWHRLLGWLSFLPRFLSLDPFYRFIARRRYRLFKTKKPLPLSSPRFLP